MLLQKLVSGVVGIMTTCMEIRSGILNKFEMQMSRLLGADFHDTV